MLGPICVGYSQHDRPYVEALVQHLGARGLAVWYDQRGETYDPVVQQAIDAASVVIIVQSPASVASLAVAHQIQHAISRRKHLVALQVETSVAPPNLAAAYAIDARGGRLPDDQFVAWLRQFAQQPAVAAPLAGSVAQPGRRSVLPWVVAGVAVLAVLAVVVLGIGALLLARTTGSTPQSWQERADAIPGLINYLDPDSPDYEAAVDDRLHVAGVLSYPMTPPAGGHHNARWQNCMGDVYPAEIAKEHAVHSLEHGAVWVTYRPDLPQDQIDALARRVTGVEFTFMSPFPGLDAPISLQAWGYQLKVDNAGDSRIGDFISTLRRNATQEPQAGCSGGITETSPIPFDG